MCQAIPDWLLKRQLDPKTGTGDVLVSTAGDGSPIAARIVVCRHCYASLSICRRYPCSWRPGRKEPIATLLIWSAERGVNTRILKRLQTAAARKIQRSRNEHSS
jgi:hypothetical protein